jgi:hypothetical protein
MGTIRKDVRDTYLIDHPEDESMLTPFLSGFFVTWARQRKEYNALLKVFFLSPEDHLKESYGFDNEILLVYAPFPTMEPRTLQAVEQIYSQSPAKGRVETLNYFLVSDAENVREWLDSYTSSRQESRIIVSFTRKELEENRGNPWFVRNRLNEQFFGRDLFNYSLPLVEDTYFFGRQQLVMEFFDSVKRKENKAIFGLRKTGKTSFLFKVKRLVETENVALAIYLDCKQPSIRKSRWFELLEEISETIVGSLRNDIKLEFNERLASKSFFRLIEAAKQENRQICLFLDEIEFVSFVAKLDPHWHQDFVEFWQTMWSCQSQLKNLSFIVAGVNPSVVETDIVNSVQNPLFGIVPHKYLTGFTDDEVRTMIKSLSRRMGMKFSYDTITKIYKWYGGHPLLTRLACSWLNTTLSHASTKPIDISPSVFEATKEKIDNELVFYCGHVVSELRDFYPDEYYMLELLSCGQMVDFLELSEGQSYIRHLMNYGIVGINDGVYHSTIPVVSQYVGLELARKEKRQLVYKIVPEVDRILWLERRVEEIVTDLRVLERVIAKNTGDILFGISSFPEADRFKSIGVVKSKDNFISFINICNRCFVEPIDIYGKSIGQANYFWSTIKSTYGFLFTVLHRIRVYRNESDHLELNRAVNEKYIDFLAEDLEGRSPSQVRDMYFVLQQRILDHLLYNTQIEITRIS